MDESSTANATSALLEETTVSIDNTMDESSIANATSPLLEEKTRSNRSKSTSSFAKTSRAVPYNRIAYNAEGWPGRASDAKARLSNAAAGTPRIMASSSIMDAIVENNVHDNENSERKVSSDDDEHDPVPDRTNITSLDQEIKTMSF